MGISFKRCPACGRRRKKSHERRAVDSERRYDPECRPYKPSDLPKTWPWKVFQTIGPYPVSQKSTRSKKRSKPGGIMAATKRLMKQLLPKSKKPFPIGAEV